jgi:hypothetical protein
MGKYSVLVLQSNKLHLYYKDQPVSAVWGMNGVMHVILLCFNDMHTNKFMGGIIVVYYENHTLWGKLQRFELLQQLVLVVTTGL